MSKIIDLFQGRKALEHRFSALVRPHIGAMYRMGYRWTQSRDDAEDLVQETLARLVGRVDEIAMLEKPGPWLIKVMYRCFVDEYRRRGRSPIANWTADTDPLEERLASAPPDTDEGRQLGLQRDLVRALETLNPDQRDVVLLHDVEGYTAVEVAEILEISTGTVKSRLHRARASLKDCLGDGTF